MKFSKFFKLISEMILRYNNTGGDHVIAWKDGVWRISDEEDSEVYQSIANKLGVNTDKFASIAKTHGFDEFQLDAYGLFNYLNDERHDVFVGTIKGNELHAYEPHTYTHGPDSPLVRKTMRLLGLHAFVENDAMETNQTVNWIGQDSIPESPEYAYHGTSVRAAMRIVRFGLNPQNDNSNWQFKFHDRVFLSTRKNQAIFHANNAAGKQASLPILFRFKIPDPSLIVPDYDVSVAYGMLDNHDEYKDVTSRYSGTEYEVRKGQNIKSVSPKTNFTKATGTFAYKGRIPANFIMDMYYRNGEFVVHDEESYLSTKNMLMVHNRQDMANILDKLNEFQYYDPYMDEEEEEEEEEWEDEE